MLAATPPSKPILDATRESFAAVMALVLDPHSGGQRAVVRCITNREGHPSVAGFVDHSELRIAEQHNGQWHIKGPLPIKGLTELIARMMPPQGGFLGPEDPDLFITDDGVLHLFFTMAFHKVDDTFDISLGHASGPDLLHLSAHEPALHNDPGFKEVCIGPVNSSGHRYILTESSDRRDIHYSTMALALAPANLEGRWQHLHFAVHPADVKEIYASFATAPDSYNWCSEHISPSFIFPHQFPNHEHLVAGIMNARASATKGKFGKFLPGLFLFDPETGDVPWIDPQPLFDDPRAHNIVFTSDVEYIGDDQLSLYAHLDDERIVAYQMNVADIKSRLPQQSLKSSN